MRSRLVPCLFFFDALPELRPLSCYSMVYLSTRNVVFCGNLGLGLVFINRLKFDACVFFKLKSLNFINEIFKLMCPKITSVFETFKTL